MTKTNEKELIVQEVFRQTSNKITEDDPLVEAIIGFRKIMEEAKQDLEYTKQDMTEDLKEWGAIFVSQYEDNINDLTLKNNVKLEILEHEIRETIEAVATRLDTVSEKTLASFDEKAKDLNMLLTKLQVNHERDTSDNFAKHFASLDDKYQQILAIQAKNKAFSQREVLFGVSGLVVGVAICLLAFLVLR